MSRGVRMTEQQMELIVQRFSDMSNKRLSELSGVPLSTMTAFARRNGLTKSAEFLAAIRAQPRCHEERHTDRISHPRPGVTVHRLLG